VFVTLGELAPYVADVSEQLTQDTWAIWEHDGKLYIGEPHVIEALKAPQTGGTAATVAATVIADEPDNHTGDQGHVAAVTAAVVKDNAPVASTPAVIETHTFNVFEEVSPETDRLRTQDTRNVFGMLLQSDVESCSTPGAKLVDPYG